MFCLGKKISWLGCAVSLVLACPLILAQRQTISRVQAQSFARYLDKESGMTADEAVVYALAHNGDLEAARKEIDATRAMVKQARLRANPKLDVEGTRQNQWQGQ